MLRQTRRLIGLVIQLNTEQGTVWSPGCICISMGHLALTEHSPPMSSPACLSSLHRYVSIWPHCVCSPLLLLFHFCWWCAPCHGPRSLQWPLLCSARAGHRSAAPFTPLIWLPWKQWVLTAQHWREQSLHRLPFHVGLGVFVTLHPAQVAQKSTKLPCYWIDLSVCSIFNILQPPVICLCHSASKHTHTLSRLLITASKVLMIMIICIIIAAENNTATSNLEATWKLYQQQQRTKVCVCQVFLVRPSITSTKYRSLLFDEVVVGYF